MVLDIEKSSEEELVALCQLAEQNPAKVLSDPYCSTKVVQLSDKILVKMGSVVSDAEVRAQCLAYENADPQVFRVPRVHRYFRVPSHSDGGKGRSKGYVFMDFVQGKRLDHFDIETHPEIATRVATIVSRVHEIKGTVPGPVGGGISRGYLWTDYGAETPFGSVAAMNAWYNRRLEVRNQSIDFTGCPLVLCHLDLTPRNIIVCDDGLYCVLDWAFSGFYPRYFEWASFHLYSSAEWGYIERLMAATKSLLQFTEEEEYRMKLVGRAYNISMRIAFPPPEEGEKEKEKERLVEQR